MVNVGTILEFEKIFPNENYEEYLNLDQFPKQKIIDFTTFLLSFQPDDKNNLSPKNIIENWFCKENNEYANNIYKRIIQYEKEIQQEIQIINSRTSFILLETILQRKNENNEINTDDTDFEKLLFKTYLAFNSKATNSDNKVAKSTENLDPHLSYIAKAFTNSLAWSDILNYNFLEKFVCEFIKSALFFEFLSNYEGTNALMRNFYSRFGINNYGEYISRFIPLFMERAKTQGNIDIDLASDEDAEKSKHFLENLIIGSPDENIEEDFKLLRNKPLLKLSDNKYRIVSGLFTIEKLYRGLYFILKDCNDNLDKTSKIKNLRGLFTYDFSEKQLLYNFLERAYHKNYIKYTGEQISNSIDGGPDYYIRKGNKVFIFESKDILIGADKKASYDFNIYQEELKKKLYFEEKENGSIKRRAIKQLIYFIKILLKNEFSLDKEYKSASLKIYPIIVIHNNQLNNLGTNKIINYWFKNERENLNKEGYNIEKLRYITIINIDTLILYHEMLKNRELVLENLIDDYLNYTNEFRFLNKNYLTVEQKNNKLKEIIVPFSTYVFNEKPWKMPKIFKEKGYDLKKTAKI